MRPGNHRGCPYKDVTERIDIYMDIKEPLAYRMRPKKLEDFVGQEHILGKDKILYRTIVNIHIKLVAKNGS